jgi:hypothetical protein
MTDRLSPEQLALMQVDREKTTPICGLYSRFSGLYFSL